MGYSYVRHHFLQSPMLSLVPHTFLGSHTRLLRIVYRYTMPVLKCKASINSMHHTLITTYTVQRMRGYPLHVAHCYQNDHYNGQSNLLGMRPKNYAFFRNYAVNFSLLCNYPSRVIRFLLHLSLLSRTLNFNIARRQ